MSRNRQTRIREQTLFGWCLEVIGDTLSSLGLALSFLLFLALRLLCPTWGLHGAALSAIGLAAVFYFITATYNWVLSKIFK